MASDNRISIEIPPAKKAAIEAAVLSLKNELQGIVASLSDDERGALPRIGDKTLAFDSKCEGYMASRPDLVPGFIDTVERAKDRKLVDDLLPSWRELGPLVQALDDTLALANADNYLGDLSFYQNVKQASKAAWREPPRSMTTSAPVSPAAPGPAAATARLQPRKSQDSSIICGSEKSLPQTKNSVGGRKSSLWQTKKSLLQRKRSLHRSKWSLPQTTIALLQTKKSLRQTNCPAGGTFYCVRRTSPGAG